MHFLCTLSRPPFPSLQKRKLEKMIVPFVHTQIEKMVVTNAGTSDCIRMKAQKKIVENVLKRSSVKLKKCRVSAKLWPKKSSKKL